ncbi:hypothetical protein Btru_007655 [Bulinus truncatus]|nr:hypothetical protein Btru_007655 [Bulinus truncatus]
MSRWSIPNSMLHADISQHSAGSRHASIDNDVRNLDSSVGFGDELFYVRERTQFCTKENVLNSVAYVNQEFQLLGLPCIHYNGTKSNVDIVYFINRLYDLLTFYHKTKTIKEDLENRNHSLLCEIERHKSSHVRLTKNQDQSDKDLNEEKEKLRQITQKYKQLCVKVKSEKDEVKRLTAVVHSRDVQYKHEQKKREREVLKLKERLHQLLSDKVPDRKVGMDLQNVISRNEGRRSTWKSSSGKQEEEMYYQIISNYEERHQELVLENGELRDCLLSFQRELSALLRLTGDKSLISDLEPLSDTGNSHLGKTSSPFTELGEGYFQMPYDIIRREIERTFKETCNKIIENVCKNRALPLSHPCPEVQPEELKEVEKLKQQVKKYQAIIQEQEGLIQLRLSSKSHSEENSLQLESQLFKKQESFTEQNTKFLQEKANFEKEKQAFTEAVIKWAKEKRQLQEEKTTLLKNHLVNMSSFKENHQIKSDDHSPRLVPAAPVFSSAKSPAKQNSDNSPAEMYKLIGLVNSSTISDSAVNT